MFDREEILKELTELEKKANAASAKIDYRTAVTALAKRLVIDIASHSCLKIEPAKLVQDAMAFSEIVVAEFKKFADADHAAMSKQASEQIRTVANVMDELYKKQTKADSEAAKPLPTGEVAVEEAKS